MSISTQTFTGSQQQNHFRPTNSRFIENEGIRSRFPPSGSCISRSGELFSNQPSNPHWINSERNTYPTAPQLIHPNHNEQQQQQALTSQLFQKHQLIPVDVYEKNFKNNNREFFLFYRSIHFSKSLADRNDPHKLLFFFVVYQVCIFLFIFFYLK